MKPTIRFCLSLNTLILLYSLPGSAAEEVVKAQPAAPVARPSVIWGPAAARGRCPAGW